MNRAKVALQVCTIVGIVVASLAMLLAFGLFKLGVHPTLAALILVVFVVILANFTTKPINRYIDKIMKGSNEPTA